MKLLDVNILVTAHRDDAEHHREIKVWLEQQIFDFPGIAVSELVLSGFLRIITHHRVFKDPTPLKVALDFVEDFRSRDTVHVLAPGDRHWKLFIDLCRRANSRGNHIPDAYHAALALEYGCEWISLDRGFASFPGLRWLHPLD